MYSIYSCLLIVIEGPDLYALTASLYNKVRAGGIFPMPWQWVHTCSMSWGLSLFVVYHVEEIRDYI